MAKPARRVAFGVVIIIEQMFYRQGILNAELRVRGHLQFGKPIHLQLNFYKRFSDGKRSSIVMADCGDLNRMIIWIRVFVF